MTAASAALTNGRLSSPLSASASPLSPRRRKAFTTTKIMVGILFVLCIIAQIRFMMSSSSSTSPLSSSSSSEYFTDDAILRTMSAGRHPNSSTRVTTHTTTKTSTVATRLKATNKYPMITGDEDPMPPLQSTVVSSHRVDPSAKSNLTHLLRNDKNKKNDDSSNNSHNTRRPSPSADDLNPHWWRPYVKNLTRTWDYHRDPTAWCKRETRAVGPDGKLPYTWWTLEQQIQEGQVGRRPPKVPSLIYVKLYKASSSTCEGVALNIAHHVGRRLFGNDHNDDGSSASRSLQDNATATAAAANVSSTTIMCMAHTRHEFADKRQHELKDETNALLWSFVRDPRKRDLSHIYHFKIARERKFILSATKDNMSNISSDSNERSGIQDEDDHLQRQQYNHSAIIDALESLKGFQTRYLIPRTTSRATRWPRYDLFKSIESREFIVAYIKQYILEFYDFLGVVERMNESLAVMVELWGLDVRDIVVLSSKRSGGYDDGGGGNMCVKIPKAQITTEIQNYFDGLHATWNADYLLYKAANKSLDETIDRIGRAKIQSIVSRIEQLQKLAHEKCLPEAMFPCSPTGKFQPSLASQSCYIQDAGCGHDCVDRVLGDGMAIPEPENSETEGNTAKTNATPTPVFDDYCQKLIQKYSFWDQRQCDLWRDVIEGNKSIDMTPYRAESIPMEDRWWPSMTELPPGSIEITIPHGRGQVEGTGAPQNDTSKTNSSSPPRRGRIVYHLHIHKSGGSFFCEIFRNAKLKRNFVRILDESGVARNTTNQDNMAVARALSRVQLANRENNCNNPDHFWKVPMNQTFYNYKMLLEASKSDAADNSTQKQASDEAIEYARQYPEGLKGLADIYDHFTKYGWHQYAPYLGDTRSTMRQIYNRITAYGPQDIPPRRRPTVVHNIKWIYVANEGSLELEPIFGSSGPYFYSILLREPIDWIISMFRYDSIRLDGFSKRKKPSLIKYLRDGIWGGPQFLTRRLCGVGCVFAGDIDNNPTREHFLRAKSFLENFDLVWTLESTDTLLQHGLLGNIFPALEFTHEQQQQKKKSSTPIGGIDGNHRSKERRLQGSTTHPSGFNHSRNKSTNKKSMRLIDWQKMALRQMASNKPKTFQQGFPASKAWPLQPPLLPKKPPKPQISPAELQLMRDYTWMDKVLYEYGKMLMEQRHKEAFERRRDD